MDKSIAFVFAGVGNNPVGGFKVVYEYANNFCKHGYDVTIFYTKLESQNRKHKLILNLAYLFKYKILKKHKPDWFTLDKRIKQKFIQFTNIKPNEKHFKNIDYICATAVFSSYLIDNIKSIPMQNKFYLIQGYETWSTSEEYVLNSYKLNLNKITIADWLSEKVESQNETSTLIYNGFDFDYFTLSNAIEDRNKFHICMLYHSYELKRCCDVFSALSIVKEKIPELYVNIFGTEEKPLDLPEWYHYIQKPDKITHNFLYNDSAIFVAASRTEGFALPPAESMICGCALVCTDIPGFAPYAINNETALTSPVYDVNKLAEHILELIRNDEKRIRIAKNGNAYIQKFTWETATDKFEQLIKNVSSKKDV